MYTLIRDTEEPLDEIWSNRLRDLISDIGETFNVLLPPMYRLDQAYLEFTNRGDMGIPDLYPVIEDRVRYEKIKSKLHKLRQDISVQEQVIVVRNLYEAKIDELLLNVDMILAAAKHDDAAFMSANMAIYGEPDGDVFRAACAWVREAAVLKKQKYPDMAAVCDAVLEMVPEKDGNPEILRPDSETFLAVKALHHEPNGYFDQLFAGARLSEAAVFTPEVGDEVTRQAIANVGSTFDLQVSTDGLWTVLHSKKLVVRPVTYTLSRSAFTSIIAHEVGSHLLESVKGSKSRLRLLELGLDHYEAGNEGRACLREEIMFDSFDAYVNQVDWSPTKASCEYRIAIHTAVSLFYGLDGRQWNFVEVYELLATLFKFWAVGRFPEIDPEALRLGAWSMAVRVAKGTAGSGGCYLKDIVYLEGNIRCWQAAKTDPSVILQADLGKFDITNTAHGNMLRAIGVL